jgi:hypothetical protein
MYYICKVTHYLKYDDKIKYMYILYLFCGFNLIFLSGSETVVNHALLGLLAKIKCSICSYQCNNW